MPDIDHRVLCSFCGQPHDQVAKLIAGPGVHICNVCVDLCVRILDETGLAGSAAQGSPDPRLPIWEAMTDEQMLEHLPRVAAVAAQVEDDLRTWVGQLRLRKVSWERVGRAL